jgi:predicted glycoside hydrolase/deacetylase ChbG (UPF0249 family)
MILHSDDYGYNAQVDEKILRLIQSGKINSLSVLSTMSSGYSLIALSDCLKKNRKTSIALHVNLTEKKLLSTVLKILSGRLKEKEVEQEIENQLMVFKRYGIKINSIDSHQHIHALSPVAQVVNKIAKKHNLKVRSYREVKNYTWIAKIKYIFLKSISLVSNVIYDHSFELPISWKIKNIPITIMSWEGKRFKLTSDIRYKQMFVTHPFLPFDSNTSYTPYIQL